MSTKQLYEKTSEGMKEVSPLVAIEDIYSKLSDTPLEALVSLYNHVKCEWKGSVADTRRTVPLFLRRSGLFITYNNGTKFITEFFSAGTDQITTEGWVKDSNWATVPDEDYISAGVKPGFGTIEYEQLSDNLKQLFREKVSVTNFPDDEDIASVDNMLKFKDREADAANFQSKGYVIIRKNLCLVNGVVKNILTQNMINQPNTIYEIRYDFDLNGATIKVPNNCILKFEGGSLNNGTINVLDGNICSDRYKIFTNLNIEGNLKNKWYCEWFGANNKIENNDVFINKAINVISNLKGGGVLILSDRYVISDTIYFKPKVSVKGEFRQGHYSEAYSFNEYQKAEIIAKFSNPNKWIIDYMSLDNRTLPYNDFSTEIVLNWYKTRVTGVYFSDFNISSPNMLVFGGMRLMSIFSSKIENIEINNTWYGLNIRGCWTNIFSNIRLNSVFNSLYIGTDATHNLFLNVYCFKLNSSDILDKVFVFNETIPPYCDINNVAVIAEGNNHDKSNASFYGCTFESFEAILIGNRCKINMPYNYVENRNIKTLVWINSGEVNIDGYFGGYTVILDSYEFGTNDGCIIAKNIASSRCWDNNKPDSVSYIIYPENSSICYYDKLIYDNETKVITNMQHTKSKNIKLDNIPTYHLVDDSTSISIGNSEYTPYYINNVSFNVTFDELFNKRDLPHKFILDLFVSKGLCNNNIEIKNKEVIVKRKNGDYKTYIEFNSPITLNNSTLIFDDTTIVRGKAYKDALFNILNNVTIQFSDRYIEYSEKPFFNIVGNGYNELILLDAPNKFDNIKDLISTDSLSKSFYIKVVTKNGNIYELKNNLKHISSIECYSDNKIFSIKNLTYSKLSFQIIDNSSLYNESSYFRVLFDESDNSISITPDNNFKELYYNVYYKAHDNKYDIYIKTFTSYNITIVPSENINVIGNANIPSDAKKVYSKSNVEINELFNMGIMMEKGNIFYDKNKNKLFYALSKNPKSRSEIAVLNCLRYDTNKSGNSNTRPSNVEIGFIYKDTTLNKLILWEGTKWVNLDGTELT